jgi:uncharacterized protein (PEP-CTERM system associated)
MVNRGENRSKELATTTAVTVVAAVAAVFAAGTACAQSWALPGPGGPGGPGGIGGMGPGGGMFAPPGTPQQGRPFAVQPSISLQETFTDNVSLAPAGSEKQDLVTQITPRLSVSGVTPRAQVFGTVAVAGLLYANESQFNRTVPSANVRGRLEAIERWFYVDAVALVTQQYQSFFGAQPASIENTSNNRFTSYSYSLAPYVQHRFSSGSTILIRNDNTWTQGSASVGPLANSYSQSWLGNGEVPINKFALGASYNRNSLEFDSRSPLITEIERGRVVWRPDESFQAYGSGGHESNNYSAVDRSRPTYGGGFRWRPIERTSLIADWERRFFGSSYFYGLNHRTRTLVFDARASRGLNTFPQSLVTTAPISVGDQLNQSLVTSIPDPIQRQQAVDQLLVQLGLPANFAIPLSSLSQQVTTLQRQDVALTFIGGRNTVTLSVFRSRTEAVSTLQDGLAPALIIGSNFKQRGGSLTWSNRISASLSANWTTSRLYSEIVSGAALGTDTVSTIHRFNLTTPFGPNTNGFAGLRHVLLTSTAQNGYRENAVIAGLDHRF